MSSSCDVIGHCAHRTMGTPVHVHTNLPAQSTQQSVYEPPECMQVQYTPQVYHHQDSIYMYMYIILVTTAYR